MRIMVVQLQNFQGGQSTSKSPTYVVRFMISPQMRFLWPKNWGKLSFSNEKMVVWLRNYYGGLSSSKYTILNHFWLGQLKPPRLTQCAVGVSHHIAIIETLHFQPTYGKFQIFLQTHFESLSYPHKLDLQYALWCLDVFQI